jgi:UDP-N-acetylmuramoylalanine--D-glutamate ligase
MKNCEVLKKLNVDYEISGHSNKIYDCDLIVTSPGVPSNAEIILTAIEKGIKVISEIEFASWFCEGKIIAITGTNGKTTTTSLCAHVLNAAGYKCYIAGNIGVPFSDIVTLVQHNEFVALEVSSFQLDHIDSFKPNYAILLNITPDHLDRYENRFDLYIKSKMRISQNQTIGDVFIYNGDDDNIPLGYVHEEIDLYAFSINKNLSNGSFVEDEWIIHSKHKNTQYICRKSDLALKGEHNVQNSLAVINAAIHIGLTPEEISLGLSNFLGVEHRLEFVREVNGVLVINDSKATNVESVWYALRSFEDPIYLILGGKDKGNDYSRIREEVIRRVKKIYAIGSSAEKVYEYFRSIKEVEIIDTLESTVNKGLQEAKAGDVFLLSPACASFDMFKNFEDRGTKFKKLVNEYK